VDYSLPLYEEFQRLRTYRRTRFAVDPAGFEVAVWFVRSLHELRAGLKKMAGATRPTASLWVAWPRKAGGHSSDVTDNAIRELVLPLGLVDVKVAALDQDWSGLKLVWRLSRR